MKSDLSNNLDIEDLISDPCPAWLWDGIAGRLYWANDAGLDFWRAPHLADLQEMKFDHAMPALRRLRKLAVMEMTDVGQDERLVFWTPAGKQQVECNCIKIAVDGYGDLLLLRLKDGWNGKTGFGKSDPKGAEKPDEIRPGGTVDGSARDGADAPVEAKPVSGAAASIRNMASSDESDVAATLREIARQVRAESKFAKSDEAADKAPVTKRDEGVDAKPGEGANSERRTFVQGPPRSGDEPQTPIDEVDFLAKISHEVRTPLNSILGFSELMMQERFGALDNEKYAEYISDIHESAALALSLINDMLDLSRMSAGQFEVSLETVDLNALSRSMLSIMRPQAEKKAIALKVELSIDELMINAGLRSIKQILLNLLSNAIKFTGAGGCVTLITGVESGAWAFLKVRDNGAGMTEPEIAKAMQPYGQLDTTTRHVDGTGLGLPITKALVDANDGTFTLTSEPGEGTEISLRFRLVSKS